MNFLKTYRKVLAGIVVLALVSGVLYSVFSSKNDSKTVVQESPFVAVARGRVDVEGGVIQLSASRDGVISEVFVEEGDRVSKGQKLATLDNRQAFLQMQQAKTQIAKAQAQIPATSVKLEAARRERERLVVLNKQGAISKQRYDQACDEEKQLEAELKLHKSAIAEAEALHNIAEHEVEQRTLKSPVDGIVVRRLARPGVGASINSVSVLFWLIPDTKKMVRVELEERFVGIVNQGMNAEVVLDANPSEAINGKVIRVGKLFGPKRMATDDPSERQDERVVECVLEIDKQDLTVGQRTIVKFRRDTQ